MDAQKDRRAHVRYPVQFLGECGLSEGTVTNLSRGGCAMESDTPPEVDTVVPLRVRLPSHEPPIEVELTEVAWTSGRCFGLRFLRLEASQATRLHCLINGLEYGIQMNKAS